MKNISKIILIILLAIAAYFYFTNNSENTTPQETISSELNGYLNTNFSISDFSTEKDNLGIVRIVLAHTAQELSLYSSSMN